ncbi:PqqD family protein [Streptomyces cinnabarinus]|uniref:PqqD family protein n=1 Tax=Streptomyces cinnabarinus TaxID=67287 RepID=A0ABY7KCJ4_9ACTN|nr:PqqD family protein [Streptomyces cinnabarinus]WAZ21803.1 PqqD family protein [Streptomyces cinnabarinus]
MAPLTVTPASVASLPLNVRMRNHRGTMFAAGYEHTVELSESAVFVWRHIDGARTVAELGALLAAEYAIDEESATEDVCELFTQLTAHGVLDIA